MPFTYVIPDLHGREDLLQAALEEIEQRLDGRKATLVTLGDYVDRGPRSRQVLERLLGWDHPLLALVPLKGNHEAMMWEACAGYSEPEHWLQNGGAATLASYGASGDSLRNAVPANHMDWIARLATFHVDQHRLYVHAGVDPRLPLEQQGEAVLLWKRYPRAFARGYGSRHVVHGHDAAPDGPLVQSGRSNLDCQAWRTGRLVVGVFDDSLAGPAIDYLSVRR